ncbi:cytochrome c [Psychrosphaera sp. B3R10]|uniref:Cytochrome c n=1 Tax=Psychrosphaera algicola TaxID=3023714 RepID=A0ABT5F811_9GAMM|nr:MULTISPECIES: cytochrome c [unclassified Psychrosphaera]MBU2880830.1 cytochrome c [Psychrosphaera sp. I2R16]MBU2990951.1 cytochrome c [Psychrosphaera sp. B3R10]MDC2887561.1 cytochrome c [Psychrosphaera sp. G1-22]MDO6720751.1 cytochrome c [Psychrosphaera sp. 1_MG-2023]
MKNGVFNLVLLLLILSSDLMANEVNQRLTQKSLSPIEIKQGQQLFEQVCASCHSKDLSGASGFNLKDAEWVHGNKPEAILHNVKTGFANAGMPAFGAIFTESQLESIVAYVISKREGWDNLSYKLYQLNGEHDKEITADKLVKSGSLPKGFADYSIPEIEHYFIEFEGDFYAPKNMDSQLWLQWGFPHEYNVFIDGLQVHKGGTAWFPTWGLKRGKQRLKVTYHSGTSKPGQRNLIVYVTNLDMTIKLFALSSRAEQIMAGKNYEITASNKAVVERKRINELPPYTISVGLPSKINYAFNTKSCSIVGLWSGDMLNIGPNIDGRGDFPSLPLGDLVFKYPKQIKFEPSHSCKYLGYTTLNDVPVFKFQIQNETYQFWGESNSSKEISFYWQLTGHKNLRLSLPQVDSIQWQDHNGKTVENGFDAMPNKEQQVLLKAVIKQ